MARLILLRHGESVWNRDNLFTGWTDVDLSEGGVNEARGAARLLKQHKVDFDCCFGSVLKRAIRTLISPPLHAVSNRRFPLTCVRMAEEHPGSTAAPATSGHKCNAGRSH